MTRRTGSVFLSLALWLCTLRALAQPGPEPASDATRAAASEHFRLGVELFREGAYAAALSELRRAHELVPDYRVHFNIAQAELALGNYVAARASFQRYLDEGGVLVEPHRRREVELQIAGLARRTARLTIRVSRPGAEVWLDGLSIGKAPLEAERAVSIGSHTISARGPDGASATRVVELAGGDAEQVALELTQPTRADAVSAQAQAPATLPPRLGRRTRWGIGLLGAGVALGLSAGTLWLLSREAHDDYLAERAVPGHESQARDAKRRADALLLSAEIGGATGAALTAGSIILFLTVLTELTSPRDAHAARAGDRAFAWDVGLGRVSFSGRF